MNTNKLNFTEVSPSNIWNYRQNHPELVIKDMKSVGASELLINFLRLSMLARGINKWLKVRRDIIAYKKLIKHDIKLLQTEIPVLKSRMTALWVNFNTATPVQISEYFKAREKYLIVKELLKCKSRVRADLKSLCMTDRWQVWEGKKLEEMNTITASDN